MPQNVLIPTDFTIESLNLLKAAAALDPRPKRVLLFHAIHLSDSITDLLFFSKARFIESIANEDFWTAVKIIRNRYASVIKSVETDLFVGRNRAAFENFVVGNSIDAILVPEQYMFRRLHSKSADPLRFIRRSDEMVRQISWRRSQAVPNDDTLAEIFQFNPELK
jgi:hypothetical protein